MAFIPYSHRPGIRIHNFPERPFTWPGIRINWLFLDLNAFFASCEQQENPALRGKPIIVVQMLTDSTCAIAASCGAKAFGIKTGTWVK
jgi:DNA polymerase-4